MAGYSVSSHVDAPVEDVFGAYADLRNAAERIGGISRIEVLTEGPIGVGTRWRETRVMFGKEATEEMEITVFEMNRRYVARAETCGAVHVFEFAFAPEGGGTRVTLSASVRPVTTMAKVLGLLAPLMLGAMKKCVLKDMEDMKGSIEGSRAGA